MKTNNLFSAIDEKNVIGALVSQIFSNGGDEGFLDNACISLGASDFYSEKHKIIFAALRRLHSEKVELNETVLLEEINKRENVKFSLLDFQDYTNYRISSKRFNQSIKILIQKAKNRELVLLLEIYHNKLSSDQIIDDKDLEKLRKEVENINATKLDDSHETLSDVLEADKTYDGMSIHQQAEYFVELRKKGINPLFVNSTKTGFSSLDNLLQGLKKDRLIVLGAAPSAGKTTLAANIIGNIISQEKKNCLIFSLEMTYSDISHLIAFQRTEVNRERFYTGQISANEAQKLYGFQQESKKMGKLIIEKPRIPKVAIFEYLIKKHMKKHTIDVVVIDNLSITKSEKGNSNYERVTEITGDLKLLASRLNVPIVVITHINRSSQEKGEVPKMHHLRDSGSIEQDADQVLLIWRPPVLEHENQRTEIIVAKNRFGNIGKVYLTFEHNGSYFKEIEMMKC